jgi:glycosyltransferase involved in cell wall biosynthesis
MTDRSRPRVLMTVEQLRRSIPGGIGGFARGLLGGLATVGGDGDGDGGAVDVTLFASRVPGKWFHRKAVPDPLAAFDRPVVLSRWPGPVMTRLWDHGFSDVPRGFDIVHSVSLAFPPHPDRGRGHAVITVHDLAWRRYPEATTPRGRRWHEAALRRARDSDASLVVTSGFVADDLVNDGVDEARITVVHGGSDHLVAPDLVKTDAMLRHLGVEGEFLLTVGTLEPRKNVQRLVAAYGRARATLPEPWSLVVVGPEGWGPDLSRTVEQEGVKFAGVVANDVLAGLYQRARAFAYVPLTEGYGLPPLEAMRDGTPSVVAWEVPSVHDLGQTGEPPAVMVDPLSVDDIAEGLTTILTNEAVRADVGARGQSYALARTWRDVALSHLALWRSLR